MNTTLDKALDGEYVARIAFSPLSGLGAPGVLTIPHIRMDGLARERILHNVENTVESTYGPGATVTLHTEGDGDPCLSVSLDRSLVALAAIHLDLMPKTP